MLDEESLPILITNFVLGAAVVGCVLWIALGVIEDWMKRASRLR